MNIQPLNSEDDIKREAEVPDGSAKEQPKNISELETPDPLTSQPKPTLAPQQPAGIVSIQPIKRTPSISSILINILGGAVILVNLYDAVVYAQLWLRNHQSLSVVFCALGAIGVLVGIGLLRRSNVARIVTIVLMVLGLIPIIYGEILLTAAVPGAAGVIFRNPVFYIVISVIVLLNIPKVKDQFS